MATHPSCAPPAPGRVRFPGFWGKRCSRATSMLDSLPPLVPLPLPEPARRELRRRAGATVRTAVRHLRGVVVRRLLRRPSDEAAVAHSLRLAFESLGATYVKLGQLVASSPGVFG